MLEGQTQLAPFSPIIRVMSIFTGPGMLLNPLTVQRPFLLPRLLGFALAAEGANMCAIRDELGAIAHAFHEEGKPDAGNRLFDALESSYTLKQQNHVILKSIECATPRILARALFQSGRYFKNSDTERSSRKEVDDAEAFSYLCNLHTQAAVAEPTGILRTLLLQRIVEAAHDSALAVFKALHEPGAAEHITDNEIAAALATHGILASAARALNISSASIAQRIRQATQYSPLHAYKGLFNYVRPQHRATDEDIVEALQKYRTQTEAAESPGVTPASISARIRDVAEGSPLAEFLKPPSTISDDDIAVALIIHGAIGPAARYLDIPRLSVLYQIRRAAADSPLGAFKNISKRRGPARRASDSAIAAALVEHGTQTAAAKALNISRQWLIQRIQQSTEGSPLHPFKGTFKPGPKKRRGDENEG